MIYTPLRRIPIGEAVQRADGTYALRIKKPNKDEFDEISMDHLVAAVIKGTPVCRIFSFEKILKPENRLPV